MGHAPLSDHEEHKSGTEVQAQEGTVGPFGDKTCKHGTVLGFDCQSCLSYIRAIGRGEIPDAW